MDANEVRRAFTRFFEERGHVTVPSASLIPHDPTVLFTIAGHGAVQAVLPRRGAAPAPADDDGAEVLPGERHRAHRHDLAALHVLRDARELQLRGLLQGGRDPLRLGPRHRGLRARRRPDLGDGPRDRRRRRGDLAPTTIGLPAERIQRLGEENVWAMGETGPVRAPTASCTSTRAPPYGPEGGPAGGGDERYLEFWNLVFMAHEPPRGRHDRGPAAQEHRHRRGPRPLPRRSSTARTRSSRPTCTLGMLDAAQSLTGRTLRRATSDADVALRRIADHGRAMTMLVADGVLPSNEGRGLRAAAGRAPRGPRRAAPRRAARSR